MCHSPMRRTGAVTTRFIPSTRPSSESTTSHAGTVVVTIALSGESTSCLTTSIVMTGTARKAGQGLASGGLCGFLPTSSIWTIGKSAELARILTELKTERAQADVDDRRSLAEFADAVAGDVIRFGQGRQRRRPQRRERGHGPRDPDPRPRADSRPLEPEQRERLAYLIRTGVLTL